MTSNNIFSRNSNSYGTNSNNSYSSGNNNGNYSSSNGNYSGNNGNYSSSNRNYTSYSNSSTQIGSYRVQYKAEEAPSYLTAIITQWREYPPASIATKENLLHLHPVELRIEDYYNIRTQALKPTHQRYLKEAITKECFNDQLMKTQCHNLFEYSKEKAYDLDALKSARNNSSSSYSSNSNSYGNNSNNNNYSSNNYNSSSNGYNTRSGANIFGSNSNSNNNSNNNSSNNSSSNMFKNNSTSGNIFNTNNSSNNQSSSSSANNMFNSRSNTGNMFNNSSNGNNSNSYGNNNGNSYGNNNGNSYGNNSNNIFAKNIGSSSNLFANNNNNNSSNNNNNTNTSGNSNNIFNNNTGTSSNIFSNTNNTSNNNSNNSSSQNLFNSNSNPSNNQFNTNTSNNLFKSNAGNNLFNTTNNNNNLFGSNNNNNLFGNNNSNNLFGNNNSNNLFANNNNNSNGNGNPNYFNGNNNQSLFTNQPENINLRGISHQDFQILMLQQMKNLQDIVVQYNSLSQPAQFALQNNPSHQFSHQNDSRFQLKNNFESEQASNEDQSKIKIFLSDSTFKNQLKADNFNKFSFVASDSNKGQTNPSKMIANSKISSNSNENSVIKSQVYSYGTKSVLANGSQIMKNKSESTRFENEPCLIKYRLTIVWDENQREEFKGEFKINSFSIKNTSLLKEKLNEIHKDILKNDSILELDASKIKDLNENIGGYNLLSIDLEVHQKIFNLPYGYMVYYSNSNPDKFEFTNLRIVNAFGEIRWSQPIRAKYIDFSEGLKLEENVIECNINDLNSLCYVTFNSLPEGIEKTCVDEASTLAAKNLLAKRVKQRSNNLFELLEMKIEPPMWMMKVNKFDQLD